MTITIRADHAVGQLLDINYESDGNVPIPNVGDYINSEKGPFRVQQRSFRYLPGRVVVLLICE